MSRKDRNNYYQVVTQFAAARPKAPGPLKAPVDPKAPQNGTAA